MMRNIFKVLKKPLQYLKYFLWYISEKFVKMLFAMKINLSYSLKRQKRSLLPAENSPHPVIAASAFALAPVAKNIWTGMVSGLGIDNFSDTRISQRGVSRFESSNQDQAIN